MKFSSSWPGASSWSPWIMSRSIALAVLHDPMDQRLQLTELVDVVAVRLRLALDGGLAFGVDLQPHHLRLGARAQVQSGVLGELRVDALEVAAAVRGEERSAVLTSSSRPRNRVHHTRAVFGSQGKHVERLGLGDAHQLACLGAVADVVAVAVREQVGRGPVDELESGAGDPLPVGGGDALAHDAPRHRDELVVHVLDALIDDLAVDGLHGFGTTVLGQERLEIAGQLLPLVSGCTRRAGAASSCPG